MHISASNEKGEKNMKIYEEPKIEMVKFEVEDVITTSPDNWETPDL